MEMLGVLAYQAAHVVWKCQVYNIHKHTTTQIGYRRNTVADAGPAPAEKQNTTDVSARTCVPEILLRLCVPYNSEVKTKTSGLSLSVLPAGSCTPCTAMSVLHSGSCTDWRCHVCVTFW